MQDKKQLWINALIAFLCALLITSASFAWVSQNRKTDSEQHRMKIEPMGVTISSFEAYKYNIETDEIDKVTEGDLDLAAYDSIFTERNINTPLLLVVRLRDIQKASNVTLNITAKCVENRAHDFATNNPVSSDDYTSNLISMKAATSTMVGQTIAADANAAAREAFFRNVCTYFSNSANSYDEGQFLTISNNTGTKVDSFDLSLSGITPEVADTTRTCTVYLLIDYDIDLVEAQNIVNFGDVNLINGSKVEFANDISSIIFSYA